MPSARSRTLLRASKALAVACGLLLIFIGTTARAENIRVTEATDYWFEFTEPTTFDVRTYAVDGYGSDPMLWLYDSEGAVIAANDDWYGLQSHIFVELQPGWYRLRASVCCGNPDAWWDQVQYDLETSVSPAQTTTSTAPNIPDTAASTLPETSTSQPPESSSTTEGSTVTSWPNTTTTFTDSPTTTQSSTTSSSTTTTQPDPTTTTSTTSLPPLTTLTVQSTTTTEPASSSSTPNSLPPSVTSSLLPTSSTVSTASPTTTNSTTVVSGPTGNVSTVAPTTIATTTTTIDSGVSEEAIAVLSEVTSFEEAQAAIETIAANIDTLTADQLEEIAQVISSAPVEVKREFESQVNVFGGGLDSYVPADSTVTVGQRRVLVAIGAVLAAAPVLLSRKR